MIQKQREERNRTTRARDVRGTKCFVCFVCTHEDARVVVGEIEKECS